MLVAFLGEVAFKEGMRLYVRRHKWGNAGTGDLWAALEESSGKPVKSIMACWTKQTGCGARGRRRTRFCGTINPLLCGTAAV